MPFVLLAALIVLVGGLMLSLRSSDGVLSTLLQRESNDARDAAETGLARIVGELNRTGNRGLMLRSEAGEDGDTFLWTSTDAGSAHNPCLDTGTNSDLGSNASIGFNSTAPYRDVLLDANGQVTTVANQAVRAYRLVAVKRVPRLTTGNRPSLRIFEADGRGTLTLVVEGMAMRRGEVISRVRLEEALQVVPKCCDTSFGGAHGPVNYAPDSEGKSICIPDAWGFVAGVAQNDTGSLTLNGNATVVSSSGTIVNPLTCIATTTQDCDFNPTGTGFRMHTVKPPVFKSFPVSGVAAGTVGTINRNTAIANGSTFLACADPTATTATKLKDCPEGQVLIDANAAVTPNYCAPFNADPALNRPDGLHCNLAEFDYSQLTVKVINTGQRPLRFFFPNSGDVLRSTGAGSLMHVSGTSSDTTPASDATRFSLFGCASCSGQTIQLAGTPEGLAVFAWFPQGDVTLAGTATYYGVVWSNAITSNGGVTWTIASSSVLSALKLAGFDIVSGDNPPTFDWVARSVRSFRWFGP